MYETTIFAAIIWYVGIKTIYLQQITQPLHIVIPNYMTISTKTPYLLLILCCLPTLLCSQTTVPLHHDWEDQSILQQHREAPRAYFFGFATNPGDRQMTLASTGHPPHTNSPKGFGAPISMTADGRHFLCQAIGRCTATAHPFTAAAATPSISTRLG